MVQYMAQGIANLLTTQTGRTQVEKEWSEHNFWLFNHISVINAKSHFGCMAG